MCPRREWFSTYQKIYGCKVLIGNNMACDVTRIGTIAIEMFDGVTKISKKVRHVTILSLSITSKPLLSK